MNWTEWQRQRASCLEQEDYSVAICHCQQLLETSPQSITAYWYLGLALWLQGEELEAQATWWTALNELHATDVQIAELLTILKQQASQCLQTGEFAVAASLSQQVLEFDPSDVEARMDLSIALTEQGQLVDAIDHYQYLIELKPDDPIAYYNLAGIFQQQGDLVRAMTAYQTVIDLDPTDALAHYNLGVVLAEQGTFDRAIACYQTAIALEPANDQAYFGLGVCFQKWEKFAEAIAAYEQTIVLNSNHSEAYSNLGSSLYLQGEFERAMQVYQKALDRSPEDPQIHWNYAILLLRLGRLEQGFVEYEWRWQKPDFPPCPHSLPMWDGSNLSGRTILLWAEQGLGDTLQFIRYASLVAQYGGRVLLECPQTLVQLLSTVEGIQEIFTLETVSVPFDTHASLLSLPHILGTTLTTVPASIPYVQVPGGVEVKLVDRATLNVGIVWASNAPQSASRCCPLRHWQSLFGLSGVAFYSLQKGPPVQELTEVCQASVIQNLDQQLNTFADTASVVSQLDLVITIDTAVAHLAGAMGKPVWTLLTYVCDWRWLIERDDSPWYPSMRLFRQTTPKDWSNVFEQVKAALEKKLTD